MTVTAATLIQRTRRYLGDWPENDVLTASVASSGNLTVADASAAVYTSGFVVEVDQEAMQVRSGAASTLTVLRGARGTTAASHANSATVLIRPQFLAVEIIDALNEAIDACFPYLYRPVADTTLTTDSTTYEFTVPNLPGTFDGDLVPIPIVTHVEIKETGDLAYRPIEYWEVVRAPTPKIKFRRAPTSGSLRVKGIGPFPHLAATTDTLDALWPVQCRSLAPLYAAATLLGSGEARRVRQDVGAVDQRENANRTGSAGAISGQLLNRFYRRLAQEAMPPVARHVKTTV